MIYHDSHNSKYKNPVMPMPCGAQVQYSLRYDGNGQVYLRTWNGAEELYAMEQVAPDLYIYTLTLPEEACQLWYCFKIIEGELTYYYGDNGQNLGGEGKLYNGDFHSYLQVVYQKEFTCPSFMHEGNIYQIFPDRFFIGNYHPEKKKHRVHRQWEQDPLLKVVDANGDNYAKDYFMGNLRGIAEKLDYLYELGIRTLYLNPIFESAANHHYDTGDYHTIDSYLGNDEEFAYLASELKKRNMHLILDGVFSHSGNDSIYFNQYGNYQSIGAYQSPFSPYADWYKFKEYPNSYACWWNVYTLPEINKNSPSYRAFIFGKQGVARSWIQKGASAWRLDVADELPMDFLQELRMACKTENKDSVLLGEVWEDASAKEAYGQMRCYCLGDTLDSVMNYPLRLAIINFLMGEGTAQDLCNVILHQREVYPAPFYYALMNLIGSHDRARILNVFAREEHTGEDREQMRLVRLTDSQYEQAKKQLLLAYALLTALPGAPTIYYGDEAGMQGTADPWNRRTFPWGKEDKDLQAKVKHLLNQRIHNAILQTGYIDAKAIDDNTIEITRYIKQGVDAFGKPCQNGEIRLVLNRETQSADWHFA